MRRVSGGWTDLVARRQVPRLPRVRGSWRRVSGDREYRRSGARDRRVVPRRNGLADLVVARLHPRCRMGALGSNDRHLRARRRAPGAAHPPARPDGAAATSTRCGRATAPRCWFPSAWRCLSTGVPRGSCPRPTPARSWGQRTHPTALTSPTSPATAASPSSLPRPTVPRPACSSPKGPGIPCGRPTGDRIAFDVQRMGDQTSPGADRDPHGRRGERNGDVCGR